MKRKTYLEDTCDKKSRAKAKLVIGDNILLQGASLSRNKQKGGTFSPSCRPVSIRLLLRVFHTNASTLQSCPLKVFTESKKNFVLERHSSESPHCLPSKSQTSQFTNPENYSHAHLN